MKTGGGACEFERLRAAGARIKGLGFGGRRGDQLDPHIIESVDQDDEALGLIALARGDHWDAVEHEGVKALSELEIVGPAERTTTKRVEIESGDAVDRLRHVKMAAEKLD